MKRSYDISKGVREAWEYRTEPEHVRALASYCWTSTLVLGVLAAACLAAYGAWMFLGVLRGEAETPSVLAPMPFTRVQLEAELARIEMRAAVYEELSRTTPSLQDPSR